MNTKKTIDISLIGSKFSYLTVIGYSPKPHAKSWECRCVCGNITWRAKYQLMSKKGKSCGCKKVLFSGAARRVHGMHKTPEHSAWMSMKYRCLNKNCKQYKNYGGRGIKICKKWSDPKTGFLNFFADMGVKPTLTHCLERIDNNKGYNPSNCKWATRLEQARNRRSTVMVTYRGKKISLSELAEKFGLKRQIYNYKK